jgi:hypothetical protein
MNLLKRGLIEIENVLEQSRLDFSPNLQNLRFSVFSRLDPFLRLKVKKRGITTQ